MHEAGGAQRVEARRHLVAHLHSGLEVERLLPLHEVLERAVAHVLLRHVGDSLVLAGVDHRHHVQVHDGPCDPYLAVEAPTEDLVARQVRLDELERDLVALGIHGLVDAPHAADTQEGLDTVGPDAVADVLVSLGLFGVAHRSSVLAAEPHENRSFAGATEAHGRREARGASGLPA